MINFIAVYLYVVYMSSMIALRAFLEAYMALSSRKATLLSHPVKIALYVAITDLETYLNTGYRTLELPDGYYRVNRDIDTSRPHYGDTRVLG